MSLLHLPPKRAHADAMPEAVYDLRRDHYTWGVRKVADEIVRVMPPAEWPELFAALHAELDAAASEAGVKELAYQEGWHSAAYPIEGPKFKAPELQTAYATGRQDRIAHDQAHRAAGDVPQTQPEKLPSGTAVIHTKPR
jgi:hypothetical protein